MMRGQIKMSEKTIYLILLVLTMLMVIATKTVVQHSI